MKEAVVYTDGSGFSTGDRPGGIGFVAVVDGVETEGSLGLPKATNQQAEILAAAYALAMIDPCDSVLVYSDSQYLVNGWMWLPGWIDRGWRTTTGKVANQRHWQRLQEAVSRHRTVVFKWVRGHDGNIRNERADGLAGKARLRLEAERPPESA